MSSFVFDFYDVVIQRFITSSVIFEFFRFMCLVSGFLIMWYCGMLNVNKKIAESDKVKEALRNKKGSQKTK